MATEVRFQRENQVNKEIRVELQSWLSVILRNRSDSYLDVNFFFLFRM